MWLITLGFRLSSKKMWQDGELLRAAYSYDAAESHASLLSFKGGDTFAVIKAATANSSWIWVCDRDAQLGYVPGNFVRLETVTVVFDFRNT